MEKRKQEDYVEENFMFPTPCKKLQEIRAVQLLTIKEMAEAIGVHSTTYGYIERGLSRPQTKTRLKIEQYTNGIIQAEEWDAIKSNVYIPPEKHACIVEYICDEELTECGYYKKEKATSRCVFKRGSYCQHVEAQIRAKKGE